MSSENPTGVYALKTRPFSEVAIPQHRALDSLSLRTARNARDNYHRVRTKALPRDTDGSVHKNIFREGALFVDERVRPGGMTIVDNQTLVKAYKENKTFKRTVRDLFDGVAEAYYGNHEQMFAPYTSADNHLGLDGRGIIGSALDYGSLVIEAGTATLDDTLQVTAESLEQVFRPIDVGILLDSALYGEKIPDIGTHRLNEMPIIAEISPKDEITLFEVDLKNDDTPIPIDPDELRVDRDRIIRLREIYLDLLTEEQRKLFFLGERNNNNVRHMKQLEFSQN